ncbi:MAG: Uma2 family endonuclease [Saprospiraceae bacterium]
MLKIKQQKMITSLSQLDFDKKYDYSDYLLWQFKERVELLKGRLFPMSAPNRVHQMISSKLHIKIGVFLSGSCDIYSAPFDVRLPLSSHRVTKDKIDTVVQPDLCVICDNSKLVKQGCLGAPDLVIEILSPGNSKREMKEKFDLYEEAGVLEYWIVEPANKFVFVYILEEKTGKYVQKYLPGLTEDDTLESTSLKGLKIELKDIFPAEEY